MKSAQILALAEPLLHVYKTEVAPPKRLKSLLKERDEAEFRRLVAAELKTHADLPFRDAFDKSLLPLTGEAALHSLSLPVFAGEVPASDLAKIARVAQAAGVDYLLVSSNQNLNFLSENLSQRRNLQALLADAGFGNTDPLTANCRVCPGNHECAMGLVATRDLARRLLDALGSRLNGRSLAISGCVNSCAQPQLADFGVYVSKIIKNPQGENIPLFDLVQFSTENFAIPRAVGLSEAELFRRLREEM